MTDRLLGKGETAIYTCTANKLLVTLATSRDNASFLRGLHVRMHFKKWLILHVNMNDLNF